MATGASGPLVRVYSNRIGEPSTGDEVYGYWLFVIGLISGVLGIILFLVSESSADMTRGAGILLGALGLLFLIAGPIIRLHLKQTATYLTYLGVLIGVVALGWFLVSYPDDWVRGAGNADAIISVYAVGLGITAVGGVLVPLLTEARGGAVSEDIYEREQTAREVAEAEVTNERTQREEIEDEITRIRDSQSQFELFEDRGGEYRWRLRHRNTNVIADSGEGYSSRQKARQGIAGVKRDAYGASVLDLSRTDSAVEAVDDATEGEDAPVYAPDAESRATFEQYEDSADEYRWRLRHDNGEIIADGGEGYASRNGLETAVERVRHYVQPADYLRVDPVAFELFKDAAEEWRWRLIHENGQILADSGEGYSSRTKATQGLESVRSNAPEDGDADFEVYEDNAGEYRWRLRHRNGEIIADGGEGYASESGAEDAVERVREYAPDAPHLDIGSAAFEIYEDSAEKWRWRLRARNGNTLADSGQGYGGRSEATTAVVRVKEHAPNADAEWSE